MKTLELFSITGLFIGSACFVSCQGHATDNSTTNMTPERGNSNSDSVSPRIAKKDTIPFDTTYKTNSPASATKNEMATDRPH